MLPFPRGVFCTPDALFGLQSNSLLLEEAKSSISQCGLKSSGESLTAAEQNHLSHPIKLLSRRLSLAKSGMIGKSKNRRTADGGKKFPDTLLVFNEYKCETDTLRKIKKSPFT
jgi:hypothetical protein